MYNKKTMEFNSRHCYQRKSKLLQNIYRREMGKSKSIFFPRNCIKASTEFYRVKLNRMRLTDRLLLQIGILFHYGFLIETKPLFLFRSHSQL